MPILNYTTQIEAEKTAVEIQLKLVKAKARAVTSEYDDNGKIWAMSFGLETPHGFLRFRIPANSKGVFNALVRDRKLARKYKNPDQARRVAWRILKDWIEAQIAIVESEHSVLEEVFLPYAMDKRGKTLFEYFCNDDGFKMLTGGMDNEKA